MVTPPIPLQQLAAQDDPTRECRDCAAPHCPSDNREQPSHTASTAQIGWRETLDQLCLLPGTLIRLCNRAASLTTHLPTTGETRSHDNEYIHLLDQHGSLRIRTPSVLYCHALREDGAGSGVSVVEFMSRRGIPAFSLLPAVPVELQLPTMRLTEATSRAPGSHESPPGFAASPSSLKQFVANESLSGQPANQPPDHRVLPNDEFDIAHRTRTVHGTAIRTLFDCIEDMMDDVLRFRIEQQGTTLSSWGRDFVATRCEAGVLQLRNERSALTLHPEGIKDVWLTHSPRKNRSFARGLAFVDRSGLTIAHIDSLGHTSSGRSAWDVLLDVLEEVSRDMALGA